jgi:ComF family protein
VKLAGRRMFRGGPVIVNRMASFVSTIGRSLGVALSCALLPPVCCLCGARGQPPDLDLCDVCLTLLPLNPVGDSASVLLTQTLIQTLVPFQYAYPVDHMIRALKFRGERVYARVLGTLLAQRVRALRQSIPPLVVPVPLHSQRYRERGFNQAQEIARFAAARLDMPVDVRCLVRTVRTKEQSGLTLAQRRRNVRGAFRALQVPDVQRIALVDDVLTTGSTAAAAAEALLDAGVAEVEIWALARVTLD